MPRRVDARQPTTSAPPESATMTPVPEPRRAPPDDRFFRHIVSNMRNGVIAIHRDGTVALMNEEAYRIFSLTADASDVGRPFNDVFRERPDVVRVLSGAFEMTTLPNRA